MSHHRFYIHFFLIFILTHLLCASECDEHSNEDKIPFPVKVQESPVVIIGTSLNKNMDINIRNLFNVTFRVECILKGRPTRRIIQIVQAGSLLGRRSCQRLDANRQYIVFLEPFFDGTYRPVDFEEVPYTNEINIVLKKTCGLSRTYPFTEAKNTGAMLTNKCPAAVSTECPLETQTTMTSSSTTTATTTTTTTTTSSVPIPTLSSFLFGKDPIDLAALSLLLAEHQQQNLSLALLQGQNHKSLFSDDDVRKNSANRFSFILLTHLIIFSFLHIIF